MPNAGSILHIALCILRRKHQAFGIQRHYPSMFLSIILFYRGYRPCSLQFAYHQTKARWVPCTIGPPLRYTTGPFSASRRSQIASGSYFGSARGHDPPLKPATRRDTADSHEAHCGGVLQVGQCEYGGSSSSSVHLNALCMKMHLPLGIVNIRNNDDVA